MKFTLNFLLVSLLGFASLVPASPLFPPPSLVGSAESLAWLAASKSENLARLPGVTASVPGESEPNTSPALAVDGDVKTEWVAKQQNVVLQLTFPKPTRINGVFWERESQLSWVYGTPHYFDIELSPDGVRWETIASERYRIAVKWAVLFEQKEVTAIRLTNTFSYGRIPLRVGEFGAFLFDLQTASTLGWEDATFAYRSPMNLRVAQQRREGFCVAPIDFAFAKGQVLGSVQLERLLVAAKGVSEPAHFSPDSDYDAKNRQQGYLSWRESSIQGTRATQDVNKPLQSEIRNSEFEIAGERPEYQKETPFLYFNIVRPEETKLSPRSWKLSCSLHLGFDNFMRGKPIIASLNLTNTEKEELTGQLAFHLTKRGTKDKVTLGQRPIRLQSGEKQTLTEALDISAVASGDYSLVMRITRNSEVLAGFYRLISIMPSLKPAMVFGIYSVPGLAGFPGYEEGLRTAAELGFNTIQGQYWGGGYSYLNDRALRYGMVWQPTIEPIYNRNDLAAKDPSMALTGPDGKVIPAHPAACFTHPEVVKQTEAEAEQWLQDLVKYPGFSGRLLADDDVHLPSEFCCYNESCRTLFRQKTGLEAPLPEVMKATKPGIVEDNNPWLQWNLFRSSDIRGNLPRIYMRAKNKFCPQAVMGAIRGHMQMPFYTPSTGEYPPLFDAQYDMPGSYAYLYWVRQMQDYIVHGAWASMGNRGKEKWIVGDFLRWFPWALDTQADGRTTLNLMKSLQRSDDELIPYPVGAFRKEMWCMLAGGFKGIGMYEIDERKGRRDIHGTELEREIQKWGKRIGQLGALLQDLREVNRPVAILTSITTTVFDGWYSHPGNTGTLFKECLREHVPVDMIAEEEILNGGLKGRKVLLLPDLNYLRRSVVESIEKFAKDGGVVIGDQEAVVQPAGSRLMKRSEMAVQAASTLQKELDCDNPRVLIREFECDGVKYYYLVNVFTDRWNPGLQNDPFCRGNNSVFADPYKPRPEKVLLRLRGKAGVVMDLLGNRVLRPMPDGTYAVELGGDDGMLLAVYPANLMKVQVTCEKSIKAGEVVHTLVKLLDVKDSPVKGAIPVEMKVTDPRGVESEYTQYQSALKGQLHYDFRTARNDTPGSWKIQIRPLIGAALGQVTFMLKP